MSYPRYPIVNHSTEAARSCSVKKETLAQVFSCEFCEIFKNTFFNRPLLVAASNGNPFQGKI